MRREEGRIYGRGSTDMKGGMAAMLGAAKALVDSGMQTRGDVWLTAVVGHEETEAQKDGPRALVSDLRDGVLNCDRILIVEGRDALWVMSMGSMVFTIRLTSPAGGTSYAVCSLWGKSHPLRGFNFAGARGASGSTR